jgi:hypothetical protein
MIVFRQSDPRYPFLWSSGDQPPGRWHGEGECPAHYLADTPDGAWAELLRHEEITDPADVATIRRALWAIDIGEDDASPVTLPRTDQTGGLESYPRCQEYARRARARGIRRLEATSAALVSGGAAGQQVVDGAEQPADPRDGRVIVIFGEPDDLVGWKVVEQGCPPTDVLPRVRHLRRPR